MCEIYPLFDFLDFVFILLTALVPDDLLVHHSIYLIIDRYLPRRFTLFYTSYLPRSLSHTVTNFK